MSERSDDFTETEYRTAATAAPSTLSGDEPTLSRILAAGGLFLAVLGVAGIVANQYGPRMITTPFGVFLAAVGFGFLLYHAFRDTDPDIRRMYGFAGGLFILAAIVLSLMPGRPDEKIDRVMCYYFLPWGAAIGTIGLLMLIAFTRAETDDGVRKVGLNALLVCGAMLTLGPVVAGVVVRDSLLGPGPVLALLGLMTMGGVFARADMNFGIGRAAAFALGLLGAIVFVAAVSYSIFPTVLHDGPSTLKRPNQTYDAWKVVGRIVMILLPLGLAAVAVLCSSWHSWVRGGLLVVGLAAAGLFVFASFSAPVEKVPTPFLVPHGIILGTIGLAYLAVALGAASDHPFVVLTRRELAAYFCSPIAYSILVAMTMIGWAGYSLFRGFLIGDNQSIVPTPKLEPILANFVPGSIFGPIVAIPLVGGLTMRLFSEEKRSGTLDVLFTTPVSDWAVITGKLFASWFFFVLCWVPPCLFLIGLRIENGEPFDFRPLLTFFLAVAVCGFEFVAIGLFFSSLTRNQIVAAFLTMSVVALEWAMFWHQFSKSLTPTLHNIADRLSYWILWNTALAGQLSVRDCVLHLSIGVLFLFLTAKSLEARKWT